MNIQLGIDTHSSYSHFDFAAGGLGFHSLDSAAVLASLVRHLVEGSRCHSPFIALAGECGPLTVLQRSCDGELAVVVFQVGHQFVDGKMATIAYVDNISGLRLAAARQRQNMVPHKPQWYWVVIFSDVTAGGFAEPGKPALPK
jgi:hypothetical protein